MSFPTELETTYNVSHYPMACMMTDCVCCTDLVTVEDKDLSPKQSPESLH